MELTSDVLEAARKGKRGAVVELLALHYPAVWRMATGLTGRADVGRGIARFIMQRSLRVLPNWKDEAAPTRWFNHHTLLNTRRAKRHAPEVANDTLIGPSAADAPYVAFIRAIRTLPMQQCEAFILSHGEKLDHRELAVAMDCSVLAAGNHLREATDRLRPLAADQFDAYIKRMADAYQKLAPDEELSVQNIRQRVRRFTFPWAFRRTIRRLISLAVLAATIWAAWWVFKITQHSLE